MTLLEKSLIFIPTIYKNIHKHDNTIDKSFDDLCNALAKRFPNLVDYAQPAEFWNKYRKSKIVTPKKPAKRKTPKKRKRKSNRISDDENSAEEAEEDEIDNENDDVESTKNNESDSDDEPLLSKKLKPSHTKNRKDVTYSQLSMDYIFNPNL